MRALRPVTLAVACASIAGAASAASISLDGVWGNEAGCKFAKEGTSEDDSFLVLKADELQSYGTGCEWIEQKSSRDGKVWVATGLCSFEGEDGLGVKSFALKRPANPSESLKIYDADGQLWGEVRKCP